MADIYVAGHLCLDIMPQMNTVPAQALTQAGKLFEVGAMRYTTGGMVANSGLALHRLGVDVGMVATLGDDVTGDITVGLIREVAPHLAETIQRIPGASSAYSVVLAPAAQDRSFLHFTGTNQTFSSHDVVPAALLGGRIFHLGYPPLLPRLIEHDGAELVRLLQQVKTTNMLTSMDMVYPDINSPTGQADWHTILGKALPLTDIFLPSIDEMMVMLRRQDYQQWQQNALAHVTHAYLRDFADELLAMGGAVVGFKLGHLGGYLRTTDDITRLQPLAQLGVDIGAWRNIDLLHPAFDVAVAGTTGAGDAAYAGFLAALLHQCDPFTALQMANAVGAYSVEAPDANSGIPHWDVVRQRVNAGWATSAAQVPDV